MYLWEYENSKYLKSIADKSVSVFGEIMIVADIVSTKKANRIATKTTNTIAAKKTTITNSASVSYHRKRE